MNKPGNFYPLSWIGIQVNYYKDLEVAREKYREAATNEAFPIVAQADNYLFGFQIVPYVGDTWLNLLSDLLTDQHVFQLIGLTLQLYKPLLHFDKAQSGTQLSFNAIWEIHVDELYTWEDDDSRFNYDLTLIGAMGFEDVNRLAYGKPPMLEVQVIDNMDLYNTFYNIHVSMGAVKISAPWALINASTS